MATFSTLATRVVSQCGDRSDITTQSQNCVADAVLDLTSSFPFEELEVSGPLFNLVANQDTYTISSSIGAGLGTWINTGDQVQKIINFGVYTDQAPTANSPTNPASWIMMNERDSKLIMLIPPYAAGTWPTLWGRVSSTSAGAQNVLFRSVPNATWTTFMQYARIHPVTGAYPYSAQTLLLGLEWESVVVRYAASMLWNGYLKEHDRAQATLLFLGLQRDEQGAYIPGMIQRLMSKRQREYPQDTQSIDVRFESSNPSM